MPILAILDVARREHALHGETLWSAAPARADALRARLAKVEGLRVFGADDLPTGVELDRTKTLIDVSALGASGYAIDDWLTEHHRVSVALSDARHLLAIVETGTSASDVRALVKGLADCAARLRAGPWS